MKINSMKKWRGIPAHTSGDAHEQGIASVSDTCSSRNPQNCILPDSRKRK